VCGWVCGCGVQKGATANSVRENEKTGKWLFRKKVIV